MKFYHVMNRQLANAKNSYYQASDKLQVFNLLFFLP